MPGAIRYLFICLFIASLAIPLALLEGLFRATGSGLSIFDTRGVGQVSMLATILLMVVAYATLFAREKPVELARLYWRERGRALRGFLALLAFAAVVVVACYVVAGLMGQIGVSREGLDQMSLKVVERTIVGLLVVLVLATTEELMFRVFLMRHLRWNTSLPVTIAAVVFSSLVFAASHNLTDPLAWFTAEDFPLFVGLFLLGVLLCVAYLATGSFWCAVAVHTGLLGSKVFLRKTQLLDVSTGPWWLGDSADLRMAPVVWALFIAMAVAIWLARGWLAARFSVERPVVSTADLDSSSLPLPQPGR